MSILVDKHTRLVVQGFTGKEGTFHAEQMFVPYSIIWVAWKVPSLPVKPWTRTVLCLLTSTLMCFRPLSPRRRLF